jgi:hypothetical protein
MKRGGKKRALKRTPDLDLSLSPPTRGGPHQLYSRGTASAGPACHKSYARRDATPASPPPQTRQIWRAQQRALRARARRAHPFHHTTLAHLARRCAARGRAAAPADGRARTGAAKAAAVKTGRPAPRRVSPPPDGDRVAAAPPSPRITAPPAARRTGRGRPAASEATPLLQGAARGHSNIAVGGGECWCVLRGREGG